MARDSSGGLERSRTVQRLNDGNRESLKEVGHALSGHLYDCSMKIQSSHHTPGLMSVWSPCSLIMPWSAILGCHRSERPAHPRGMSRSVRLMHREARRCFTPWQSLDESAQGLHCFQRSCYVSFVALSVHRISVNFPDRRWCSTVNMSSAQCPTGHHRANWRTLRPISDLG